MKRALKHLEAVAELPLAVAEIGKIRFEGNIIPHQWYQHITLASGKPDLPAITLLAELVYWYRPYQTLTKGGRAILKKHFDGDMFQCTAAYFTSKFGFSKDQVRKALKRLEDAGYIRREYRYIIQQGILRNNVMFIEPVPLAILAITHPETTLEITPPEDPQPTPVGDTLSPVGDTLSPVGDTLSPVGDIFKGIEITTEISTETTTTTTTPYPSSSKKVSAKADPVRGGRGVKDQTLENQASDRTPATAEEDTKEKTVIQEAQPAAAITKNSDTPTANQRTVASKEVIKEQRLELIYPVKLTEAEHQDMAAQLASLPSEIAQQMLNVIEAKIKAEHIKTTPAAVLRGIIRKYRQDQDSFDPSIGFQIAEERRRRVENDARLRAAETYSVWQGRDHRQYATVRTPEQSELGKRAAASILGMLRGGG